MFRNWTAHTFLYMYITIINEKETMNLREQGEVDGRVWKKEREEGSDVIIS